VQCARRDVDPIERLFIGKSYPATTHVDFFLKRSDIKVEHEVMGRISGIADEYDSFEDVKGEMESQAMDKGADALLIEGMEPTDTGSTETSTERGRIVAGVLIKYRK